MLKLGGIGCRAGRVDIIVRFVKCTLMRRWNVGRGGSRLACFMAGWVACVIDARRLTVAARRGV